MIRLTFFAISADTAIATARYVLPVPAGPSPKVMSPCSIASTYFLWLGERGCTIRFTPAERCLPESTSDFSVTAGIRDHQLQHSLQLAVLQRYAAAPQTLVVGEDAFHLLHSLRRPGHLDRVRTKVDRHMKAVFHQPKVLVAGPIQGLNTRRDLEGFFNQAVF